MGDALDPWSIDYFSPPTPHVAPPSPKARPPKPVPEAERLFQAQRDILVALRELDEVKRSLKDVEHFKGAYALQRMEQAMDNTYRVIRSYLAKNVAQS